MTPSIHHTAHTPSVDPRLFANRDKEDLWSSVKTSHVAAVVIGSLAAIFIGIPLLKLTVVLVCGAGIISLFNQVNESLSKKNKENLNNLFDRAVSTLNQFVKSFLQN